MVLLKDYPSFSVPTNTPSQDTIDEQIATHETFIIQRKRERNGLSPVYKLPLEMLCNTFSLIVADRTRESPIFPCYYFTHVSSLWRTVALNMPRLWQFLPENKEWINIMLKRSRSLDLIIDFNLKSGSNFLDDIKDHTTRIRELNLLCGIESHFLDSFEDLSPSSLRLRSLKLHSKSPFEFRTEILSTENLQTLSIVNCPGHWYSLSLPPTLTILRLHGIEIPSSSVSQFMEFVRRLPALQELDLRNSFPIAEENKPPDTIELPNLRFLRLSSDEDVKDITNVLSLIKAPPTVSLNFSLENDTHIQPPKEISSSISAFFHSMGPVPYRKLHVLVNDRVEIKAWKDDDTGPAALTFRMASDDSTASENEQWLLAICQTLPLPELVSLTLSGWRSSGWSSAWRQIFGNLSRLRSIKLVGKWHINLPDEEEAHGRSSDVLYSISFPALRDVWIHDTRFVRNFIKDLKSWLERRHQFGAEPLNLKFTNCSNSDSFQEVKELRKLSNNLEYDGEPIDLE